MPGEWRIENQNRELRVRTLVKGGMLGEWRMENQNRELRVQTLCQRRYAGRMENGESETRLGVALTGRIYRIRIKVKLEQKRESELPNWVRLDHHSIV